MTQPEWTVFVTLLALPACQPEPRLEEGGELWLDARGPFVIDAAQTEWSTRHSGWHDGDGLEVVIAADADRPEVILRMFPYPPTNVAGTYHWAMSNHPTLFWSTWRLEVDGAARPAPERPCPLTLTEYPEGFEEASWACPDAGVEGTLVGQVPTWRRYRSE
ncbi:MAG: hypothetical protein AAF928_16885 [Myxococcota bacterium]